MLLFYIKLNIEIQAVASKELDKLDGEAYPMDIIKNNNNPTITPYGVLCKNSNEPEQVYDGKHSSPYQWQETMATVELIEKGKSEFIYLPCSDIEIEKALMRLVVPFSKNESKRSIENRFLEEQILNIYKVSKCRYGAPKIHQKLKSKNIFISLKRTQRPMNELGIKSVVCKKFRPFSSKNKVGNRENILGRNFSTTAINQK